MVEENHYYPFGLSMAGLSDKALKSNYVLNRYRYNGKVLQTPIMRDGTGWDAYDFGTRYLDPQLGVWHNPDPLADLSRRWSPYAFAYNNPIRFIDPDGMEPIESADFTTYKGVDAENGFRQLQSQSNKRNQNGDDGDEEGKEGGGDKDKKNATPANQSKDAVKVLGGMDKEQAEKLKSILEKADYFNIEFQYGEKIISSTGALTIRTSNGVLKIAATAAQYTKIVNALDKVGYIANGLDVAVNTAQYTSGEIGGARYAYRLVGTGASLLTPIIYSALVGSEAGPWGTVAGIVVGVVWSVGERAHDVITREFPITPVGYDNINIGNAFHPL
jgi:RHS repeat-associated protein